MHQWKVAGIQVQWLVGGKLEENPFDTPSKQAYITKSDFSIRTKAVTRRDGLKILRSHTAASRVLVLLLLGFLIFETTVEAAHRHGRVLRSLPSSASSIGSPRSDNLAGGLLGCNDCVICQLQQSFSASLITTKPHSAPLCLRSDVSSLASVSVQSQILVPQCGRAPPFTL